MMHLRRHLIFKSMYCILFYFHWYKHCKNPAQNTGVIVQPGSVDKASRL